MSMSGAAFLSFSWLMLQVADGELDYFSKGHGMYLQGNFSIAGFFPVFYGKLPSYDVPALDPCNKGDVNPHGFHLTQAMRFTVEQINNSTGPRALLPGVKLGYQLYDVCSVPAGILAALDLLEQQNHNVSTARAEAGQEDSQRAVAVIGPDSSSKTFTPAALMGAYLIPQISYEASNEMLSNKYTYPSFFRTIPSDKNQVRAMIQILARFNWTWIALLGSDNAYGRQGMQSLADQAVKHDICIAFQGVIPSYTPETEPTMRKLVEGVKISNVNTIVVFSSKSKLKNLIPYIIQMNVTEKVWIGTEDWSASALISSIKDVHTIGTVIGVAIKSAKIPGFEEFERKVTEASVQHSLLQEVSNDTTNPDNDCLHSTDLFTLARKNFTLGQYDIASSLNVYKGVYAVAHALHQLLDCDSGVCSKRRVYPWQLLPWLKEVRFPIGNDSVYFDENGDPPSGYDIITWIWRGTKWSVRVVGSFSPDPITLTINEDLIEWHQTETSRSVPVSICSPPCPTGHKKLLMGQHSCCFDCQACPPATFFNRSEPTTCQPCQREEWAPAKSEHCLKRSILLLDWDNPLTIALLFFMACCLLMTCSSALILLINLNTPVAKSAGGRTCLLMLAALTAAAMSSLCHFGHPSPLACILKQPLFSFSFTVCLACIAVRSFQVVCIFKFASKLPPIYDKWAKKHGPEFTIFLFSITILFISVLRVAINPPEPSEDLKFYDDSIILECSNTLTPGSVIELGYVSMLSVLCFFFSYLGKDLPANYNEAKCITFSLMVYMISWISFFTIYLISRGPFTIAAQVFATLFSVLAFICGYFLPKIYIIVLRPQMNTASHFQNCIQMYTMNKQ
uniref:G-protein coupled receptors family 3 profile domain-containing protein n=2 Tax=Sphaeramia orbicularis TaxID=375764 RepID=A0A672ZIY2_9TELE